MRSLRSARGFSIIELTVAILIVAVMMALTAPSIMSTSRNARERAVPEKFLQDFTWARGAAGAGDAASLQDSTVSGALTGAPTVKMTVGTDCTWSTTVNNTVIPSRSMTTAQLSSLGASALACTNSNTNPFTFTSQGTVSASANLTFTGSTNSWQLQVLGSGAVVRTKVAS
jgi:prepilin-type N-terminal cleavage/methylation domain-containing protein